MQTGQWPENFAPGFDPTPDNGASPSSAIVTADDILLGAPAAMAMPSPTETWFDSGETGGFPEHAGQLHTSRMLFTTEIL